MMLRDHPISAVFTSGYRKVPKGFDGRGADVKRGHLKRESEGIIVAVTEPPERRAADNKVPEEREVGEEGHWRFEVGGGKWLVGIIRLVTPRHSPREKEKQRKRSRK